MSLEALQASVAALAETVAKQSTEISNITATLKSSSGSAKPTEVFATPAVRTGESALSSRGYSFLKAIGVMRGLVPAEHAKVELDVHNKLQKALVTDGQYEKAAPNSFLVPFATEYLPAASEGNASLVREIRQVVRAGSVGYDPEEVFALRMKAWGVQRALSWLDETTGGALVAPPMMGELITLLRNNLALMQAGCRQIPMPPNGRTVWPRQTGGATAYWVGQSTSITDSQQSTGDLNLTAKKLGVLVKIPNELFRFASISVEQFVREDIAQVMALKMDKSMLEAAGSALEPKGLINYSGITALTATTTAADGDTVEPEDIGRMIAAVEEKNAEFKAWIMRPLQYTVLSNRRADATTPGDRRGPFMFNMMRDFKEVMDRKRGMGVLEGYPVSKSTQISVTRTKGSASNLSYILGGDFNDYIIAQSAVIEFLGSNTGDTAMAQDQTWIRGIHYCDSVVSREASFVLMDQLKMS